MSHIILRPKAQFGNILFQFAFAKVISIKLGDAPVLIDRTFGGKILIDLGLAGELKQLPYTYRILYEHRNPGDKINNFLLRHSPFGYTHINQTGANEIHFSNLKSKVAIHGRFQNYQLFSAQAATIRDCVKSAILKYANIDNIETHHGQLAVHIRRGDYMQSKYLSTIGALDRWFYMRAIREVISQYKIKKIIIFTDDAEDADVQALQHEFGCQCQSGNWIDDFIGIMASEYRLISNSTFSWWAAFLGAETHPEKIYAPNSFTIDSHDYPDEILPSSWKTIPSTWIKEPR
jgi:hypothetical protein